LLDIAQKWVDSIFKFVERVEGLLEISCVISEIKQANCSEKSLENTVLFRAYKVRIF